VRIGRLAGQLGARTTLIIVAIVGAVFVLVILGLLLLVNNDAPSSAYPAEMSVAQAAEQRSAGALILDVREQKDWDAYHITDSTHIPLGSLASRFTELPRDKVIVVVDRSGNLSKQGRDILIAAGFVQVTSMTSGVSGWRDQGLPTTNGN
jgi:rhodanese-related sulfurtransferase